MDAGGQPGTGRGHRGGAPAVGPGGLVALLRWRLWSSGVPDPSAAPLREWFDPAELARNRDYRRGLWTMAVGRRAARPAAAAVGVALTGRRWRPAVVRAARARPWRAGLAFGVGLSLVTFAVTLPLGGHRATPGAATTASSRRAPAGWVIDQAKGLAISLVIAAAVAAGAAALIARAPRFWWAGMAAAIAVFIALMSLLSPLAHRAALPEDAAARRPGPDGRGARPGPPARGEGRRREGQRRERPHHRGQRLRLGARREPPHHPVRHPAARLPARPGARGRGPRADPRRRPPHPEGLGCGAPRWPCRAACWSFAVVGWRTGFGKASRDAAGCDLVLRRLAIAAAAAAIVSAASAPLANWVSRAFEREADWGALERHARPGRRHRPAAGPHASAASACPTRPPRSAFWFGAHPSALERIALAAALARRGG